MELGLTGKVALVTGGSVGIGKATALALAQEGARVAICARGREQLEQTAKEIETATGNAMLAVVADMAQLGDIQRLVATTADALGGSIFWSTMPSIRFPDGLWNCRTRHGSITSSSSS